MLPPYASASAEKHMVIAKSFFKERVGAGIISVNPFRLIKIERQKNSSRRRFNDADVIGRVIEKSSDERTAVRGRSCSLGRIYRNLIVNEH
jgi:hypothetical protein